MFRAEYQQPEAGADTGRRGQNRLLFDDDCHILNTLCGPDQVLIVQRVAAVAKGGPFVVQQARVVPLAILVQPVEERYDQVAVLSRAKCRHVLLVKLRAAHGNDAPLNDKPQDAVPMSLGCAHVARDPGAGEHNHFGIDDASRKVCHQGPPLALSLRASDLSRIRSLSWVVASMNPGGQWVKFIVSSSSRRRTTASPALESST